MNGVQEPKRQHVNALSDASGGSIWTKKKQGRVASELGGR